MSILRMGSLCGLGMAIALLFCTPRAVGAQDLSPRAYLITAYHSNAVNLT
jgi:hypothetical protein